ncbi:MAG: GTP-binding protein [Gammaproteobacteria bacterium]|nr:GTP-binding protein [Gammaproteobacteria bacterium]
MTDILQDRQEPLPVSVLTGFLGSGKTTVLNHLIQQHELGRTLVLINEFGEIGLDHVLVAHSRDEVVIEMSSGCLCCTIRGDLVKTLREAPVRFVRDGRPSFDRVVIETTGLADPAPILHTLMTDAAVVERYRLDGVIATIDAVNGGATLDQQVESVKQAAVADRLLITKTDLAGDAELARLQRRLRTLNPAAPQVITQNGAVDPESLFDAGLYDPKTKSPDVEKWLRAEAYEPGNSNNVAAQSPSWQNHAHHDHDDLNRHDAHIKALCVTIDEPIRGDAFDAWLDLLLLIRGANFLRIKGIINVVEIEEPVVIHGVQHIFHPPVTLDKWPSEDRRSRIVFITRDIEESVLRDTLKAFRRTTGQSRDRSTADVAGYGLDAVQVQ